MKVLTRFQEALLKEYNRTRRQLRTRLKRSMAPADVKAFINESFTELTERQAKIIIQYTYKTFKKGISDADEEISSVRIAAAAAAPNIPGGTFKFDLDTVSTKQMNRIMHHNLGAIGKYNVNLSKAHQAQYNLLLSDSKLLRSLNTYGWTPWLEEEWKKRGIAPEIIKLIKGQKTSAQMISILNWKGIVLDLTVL
jgi:cell division FtsZ-interacting protein ZapD